MEPLRIVEINYSDLKGRIFNGFDLHQSLNERDDVHALQYVLTKSSTLLTVESFKNTDEIIHGAIKFLEQKYSISELVAPYGKQLLREQPYLDADIIHMHIFKHTMISLLDVPTLMARDNVVWTIHDPWYVTGNCIHPLQCSKWRTGCYSCNQLEAGPYKMQVDNTSQMWKLKKDIFSRVNPYVVVASSFIENYIRNSPLTAHWNRIFKIPFGIKKNFLTDFDQSEVRTRLGIDPDCFVIGFRLSKDSIKGCEYIFEALEGLESGAIQLVLTGEGVAMPASLRRKYRCIGPAWCQEEDLIPLYQAMDVFLMPSLAETFGMMAIEAMACETVVICFQSTVLEEVTRAPSYGIAVEYCSAKAIEATLNQLIENREALEERKHRSKKFVADTYPFEKYVERHLRLYQDIKKRNVNYVTQ